MPSRLSLLSYLLGFTPHTTPLLHNTLPSNSPQYYASSINLRFYDGEELRNVLQQKKDWDWKDAHAKNISYVNHDAESTRAEKRNRIRFFSRRMNADFPTYMICLMYIHKSFFLDTTPRLFWSNRDPIVSRVLQYFIPSYRNVLRAFYLLPPTPIRPFFQDVGNKYRPVWKSWKSACSKV